MSKQFSLLSLLLLLSVTAFGQRRAMDTQKMAERQTTQLQERLTEKGMALTDESLEEVKALNIKYAEKMKALREENQGDRMAMKEAGRELETEKRKELKKILTKDQFKEYKAWMTERMEGRRERRGGMRGF
ncbi:MAG: hypothetical protein ACPGJS_00370 [Flammeovirgaceae bacterium]